MANELKIKPGDKFKVPCADNYAYYVVTRVGRTIGYKIDPDVEDSYVDAVLREKGSAPFSRIAPLVASARMWAELLEADDAKRSSASIGDTLHYKDFRGRYVRGEVVAHEESPNGLGFKSLALIGDWSGYELPTRRPDGEIHYPYHAEKVKNGTVGSIPGCCVEFEPSYLEEIGGAEAFAALPVVDISVPDMTEGEVEKARLYRATVTAKDILAKAEDPKAALEAARDFIDNALKN